MTASERVASILAMPPTDVMTWKAFWDDVREHRVEGVEIAAVLAATANRMPTPETFVALVGSLVPPGLTEKQQTTALNIVGTGGGPSTFNISTAAALVVAALKVPTVKTGSRSYSSSRGALDLLGTLGVDLQHSAREILDDLGKGPLSFASIGVYPSVFVRVARAILPLGLSHFGRLFNSLGPFVADVPVSSQLTGVSSRLPFDCAAAWADLEESRSLWICESRFGADELISFTTSRLRAPRSAPKVIEPGDVVPAGGSPEDLLPVAQPEAALHHLCEVLTGQLNHTATHTVALNAGAGLMAAGECATLKEGVALAIDVIHSGSAVVLLESVSSAWPKLMEVKK